MYWRKSTVSQARSTHVPPLSSACSEHICAPAPAQPCISVIEIASIEPPTGSTGKQRKCSNTKRLKTDGLAEADVTRGELYRVSKPGGDPKQHRTFVIVSRQALIDSRFSTVICAPVFSNGEGLSTQVRVGPDEGLKHQSW